MILLRGGSRAVLGLALLTLSAAGRAADERSLFRPKVTVDLRDVPVFKVVDALRDQTGLCFHPFHTSPAERARMYGTGPGPNADTWNWQVRQVNPTVSVAWKDLPLDQAIADLARQTGLTILSRGRGGGYTYLSAGFQLYRQPQTPVGVDPAVAARQPSVTVGDAYRVRLTGAHVVRSRSWAFGGAAPAPGRDELRVSLEVDRNSLWDDLMLIGVPRLAKASLDGKALAPGVPGEDTSMGGGRTVAYRSLGADHSAMWLTFAGADTLEVKALSLEAELLVRAPMKEQVLAVDDLSGKPAEQQQGGTAVTLAAWGPATPQAANRPGYRGRVEQPAWQATLRIRRPLVEADAPDFSPQGNPQWEPVRLPLVALVTEDGKRLLGTINATPTEVEQTGDTITYTTTALWPAIEGKPDGLLVAVLEPGGPMQHLPIKFENVPLP